MHSIYHPDGLRFGQSHQQDQGPGSHGHAAHPCRERVERNLRFMATCPREMGLPLWLLS